MSAITSAATSTDVFSSPPVVNTKDCDLKLVIGDAQLAAGVFHIPTQTFTQVLTPPVTAKGSDKKASSQFNDFADKHLSGGTYHSVTAAFLSPSVTLVPNGLYDDSSKDDYMCLVEQPQADKTILADKQDGNDFTTVFSEDTNLVNAVKGKFAGCNLTHVASSLIPALQKEYASGNARQIFAYVLPGKLQIIVTGKDKPVFYNIFSYSTPEDFIYFILSAYKKLGFDTEKNQLLFLGEIVSQSKLFELTVKYVRHVGFGKRPAANYSPALQQFPPHFYYSLFCIV